MLEIVDASSKYDDDGRFARTGTMVTASAHIITAVIGIGVLSLPWCMAQLGWIAGPIVLLAFSCITFYTSALLTDCYRSPDPVYGKRNYTYMDAVKANLGGVQTQICGAAQYVVLVGITVGFTVTASTSMAAIKRSNCFHKNGHEVGCHTSNNIFMIIFAVIQIILSQIPNFHKLSGLSIVAAVMSFAYSSIGLGLSIAAIAGGKHAETSMTGIPIGENFSSSEKIYNTLQALGNVASAYSFSMILVEIQDTLKSSPPENKVMKKAAFAGISVTTFFYMICGVAGYAAFGNKSPGNLLTGFAFYEPFWLIDAANIGVVIHLVGAYQVFSQPIFRFMENLCSERWPENIFIARNYSLKTPFFGVYDINFFRLIWRTGYVVLTSVVAMIFPLFNEILGLIGAATFWPLTVYFPIQMYIARAKIQRFSFAWVWLQTLSSVCLVVSLLAAVGSIQGLITSFRKYKPFESVS